MQINAERMNVQLMIAAIVESLDRSSKGTVSGKLLSLSHTLTLVDAKWRGFNEHHFSLDQEFNQLLNFTIDKKRYCLNTPGGQYYYAHVCDISDSFCDGKLTFGLIWFRKREKD